MIGICLKYEQNNYGSKLQALATLKIFQEMGLDYQLLKYGKKDLGFKLRVASRIFNPIFLNDQYDKYQKKIKFRIHPEVGAKIRTRTSLFSEFDKRHFSESVVRCPTYRELQRKAAEYSAIVTCSDQLWSPAALSTNFYNLMFVPEKIKKISFSSSFGVSKIPWYQANRTKRYLNRIEHISVRENQGQAIVKSLTGRDVPVLMDPIFTYSKEEWEEMIPLEKIYNEPYIFSYFLGANPNHRIAVKKLAKKTGLKIVTLPHLDRYVPEDEEISDYAPFNISPEAFLNIIRGAEYICTDSFHGCAFSIICEKKFIVYNRYNDTSSNSKNSRIDTICANLDLLQRRISPKSNIYSAITQPIDYGKVKLLLQSYRQKIREYLHQAFEK